MSEDKMYTLEEAHTEFAKKINGEIWDYLEKKDRTPEEDEAMLMATYASYYHWTKVGTMAHRQRGEWMLSRVYTVLGRAEPALLHAQRCLDLTEANLDEMADFDKGYAFEAMARSHALAGEKDQAKEYLYKAKAVVETIADDEDRQWFEGDINGGEWYGIA
jgi:tetratricopeptide (TPR) repeat protein